MDDLGLKQTSPTIMQFGEQVKQLKLAELKIAGLDDESYKPPSNRYLQQLRVELGVMKVKKPGWQNERRDEVKCSLFVAHLLRRQTKTPATTYQQQQA